MSNYKKKEVMDYLTRKPVTPQDFEIALDVSSLRLITPKPVASIAQPETDYQTEVQPDMVVSPQDVLPKGAEPVMPSAPGIPNPQDRQIELAEGGTVNRENYALGSQYQKNLLKKQIPNVRVRKQPDGKLYIAGRYTKDGQRMTAGVKTFDPATATQKEVDEFLKTLNKKLSGKIIGRDEALQQVFKTKLDYTELRKQYTTEVMDWLDETSKNPKYKTTEQLQKDLFKQFNQPKYTEAPKGVDPKSIFFKDNKFSIPRETEIFGRKVGAQKVPEKTVNDLSDFFLLKNNPNFEKVRDVAYDFFTNKKADINKYPAEQQKILRNFSKEFIKGQIKGEAGESIFLSGLKQEGLNFNNKVNEALYIKSLEEKIKEELTNPNISKNRNKFLNLQLDAIENQRTTIIKDLNQRHPNLFRALKHPGNLVYEHKVPRYIKDIINLPYDYLAKATFAPNAFNNFKLKQFDGPLGKLIEEYNSTNDLTSKNEISKKIEKLKNDFNNKTKVNGQGYLDEIDFEFGNKVKIKDNTPLISDLTTEDVYRDILRNAKHSNKFFEKEGLNKYIVKGEDFKNYVKDLENRITTKSGSFYSFPGQIAELEVPTTLTGKVGTAVSEYSRFAGGPIMATLGAVLNYPSLREEGFGKIESLGLGAAKGLTQDTFNFALDTLPMPAKYSARGAINDVAKEMEAKGENPYVEGTGPIKVLDVTKFDWNRFAEKHPGFFNFFDKATKYISENILPEEYKVKNIIEKKIKYDPNAPILSQYYDLYDTRSADKRLSDEQEKIIKQKAYEKVLEERPDISKKIQEENLKKETLSSTGPFYFGTEPSQEFAKGGRAKFASGSDDPESDLYIPPLETPQIKKDGVEGLYFGLKEEPRMIPLDEKGNPITSGGIRELKKIFSSMLSDSKPEIGYGTEKFNISASKGINPFQGDRDIRYQATYTPEGDVGKFMIGKTPQALGAGYSYQKDGLDLGITGLKNQMGDKSIMLRFGYNYNNGGRVNFSGGGGAIKLARLISESLLDLKNNITMVSNTARFSGAQKAKLEALTPYRNIPNESRHTSILKSIEKAKENLPREYHSILDDIKKDVDNFDYSTADVRIKALDKEVAPEIRFEGLSQDLFPMEDPLNNAFIIMDPQRNNMRGRYVNRVRIDPETGRGTRETFDTFDSKTKTFLKEEDWKPVGVESLEKGKEGLN